MDIASKFPAKFSKYLLDECELSDLAELLPDWSCGVEAAGHPPSTKSPCHTK